MTSRRLRSRAKSRGVSVARSLLYVPAAMTRFDRFWEPFLVIVAGLMIFSGTL
jgi:hypothetical protein